MTNTLLQYDFLSLKASPAMMERICQIFTSKWGSSKSQLCCIIRFLDSAAVSTFVLILVELTNTVFVNSTPRVDSSMIILIFSTCDHQIKTLPSQYIVIGRVRYSQFLGCFLHLCNRFTYLFCTFGRPFDEFIIGGWREINSFTTNKVNFTTDLQLNYNPATSFMVWLTFWKRQKSTIYTNLVLYVCKNLSSFKTFSLLLHYFLF